MRIDAGEHCGCAIFAATGEEFNRIFPDGTDIAFIDEVYGRSYKTLLDEMFANIWSRQLSKPDVRGIHGTIFCGMAEMKSSFPSMESDDACHWSARLRASVARSYNGF